MGRASVILEEYNSSWPSKFESEEKFLMAAVGEWNYGGVEHVGSTAVVGMVAKPIIDIMFGVKTLNESKPAIDVLVEHGYEYWPYKTEIMHWFCKPSDAYRTHHLHLIPFESPLWKERIKFRELLRSNIKIANKYADLKRELAVSFKEDREAYTEKKWPFIQQVLHDANKAVNYMPSASNYIRCGDHTLEIKIDDLGGDDIAQFLQEHIEDMKSVSPPESKHALDLDALRQPDVTFWSVWNQGDLVGCGALKELDSSHAEIKSMRVSSELRGRGVASQLLIHILNEAKIKGYITISLETGSMPFFDPARKLYEKFGFKYCTPFADYNVDPNSVFMSLGLDT